ncbi:MAG: hypothetical protein SFU98_06170 [Leptospiraceae bacterium]|nr:hypothetical protein [Leptospiraceae bacterium]
MISKEQKEKILQAHIEFELKKVQSQNLEKTIQIETEEYLNFFLTKKPNQVLPKEKLKEFVKIKIKEIKLEQKSVLFIQKLIRLHLTEITKDPSKINSVLNKESFFALANDSIGLKELRTRIIHFAVNSKAYSRMISSIILASIKDFMINENPLAKNPLAGSFFKMGENFLNNLPGMQGNFDKKAEEFIQANLSGRIQQSEKLINGELDSGKANEILEEFWNFLSEISFQDIPTLVPEKEFFQFLDRIPGFWIHVQNSGLMENWILSSIEIIYNEFENKTYSEILEESGISKEFVSKEISLALFKTLDNDTIREYYKQRLEARLKEFYSLEWDNI